MKQELDDRLVSQFPILYKDRYGDMRNTAMCWGFSCGDGWYELLWNLSNELTDLDKKDNVRADQVKEKFGTLRFYYTILNVPLFDRFIWKLEWELFKRYLKSRAPRAWVKFRQKFYKTFSEKIDEIVYKYEAKSAKICERCGAPGKMRDGGWLKVRCDRCYRRDNNETR